MQSLEIFSHYTCHEKEKETDPILTSKLFWTEGTRYWNIFQTKFSGLGLGWNHLPYTPLTGLSGGKGIFIKFN